MESEDLMENVYIGQFPKKKSGYFMLIMYKSYFFL